MNYKSSIKKTAQKLFAAKAKRRHELAGLPFDKKIEILIQLQKIAEGVPSRRQKMTVHVWNLG